MEELIKVIFWIVIGLVWFISALAKKRRVEKSPFETRPVPEKPESPEVYEASEDELSRFLRSISGVREVEPEPKPKVVEKVEPVHVEPVPQEASVIPAEVKEPEVTPEPKIEAPPPVEPVHIEPEPVQQRAIPEKPPIAKEKIVLPALTRLSISDLKRGIILSEILGPPRAMRPHRRRR